MIYHLLNEMVKISREYPSFYDLFCVSVIFIIAAAYNSFKRLNINLLGIFLSSTLSYCLLYLVWKVKIFNLTYNADMKLIICILTGFISIEFFTRFNPAVVVSFLIELGVNTLLRQLDKYDRGKKTDVKEGVQNESKPVQKEFSEIPTENLEKVKKDDKKDETLTGFQRTK